MTQETIGLGDRELLSDQNTNRYKGEEDVIDRISFCYFAYDADGNPVMSSEDTPVFKREYVHYLEGKGYVKTSDYLEKKKGEAKPRVATVIVVYNTNDDGEFPTDADGKPKFGYQVMTWEFGRDKYKAIAKLNKDWPISYHDIKADCDGEKFQSFTFRPCKGEALWRKKPELREKVLEKAKEIGDAIDIGRDLPKEELREYFGEDSIPQSDVSEDVEDYDDLLGDI